MTIWSQIKKIPDLFRSVNSHYNHQLPIIVRDIFAQWIEEQQWNSIEEQNIQHLTYSRQLISSFLKEIQNKLSTNLDYNSRNTINEFANQLSRTYVHNPFLLIKIIKDGLQFERNLLEKLNYQMVNSNCNIRDAEQRNNQLDDLRIRCQQAEKLCEEINQTQEETNLAYQRLKKITDLIDSNQGQIGIDLNKHKNEMKEIEKSIHENLDKITSRFSSILILFQDNQNNVEYFLEHNLENELKKYHRQQQLVGNQSPQDSSMLDNLQIWSEGLVDCILHDSRTINRAQYLLNLSFCYNNSGLMMENFNSLNDKYTSLLVKIIQKTFIITKQPPQVMKTHTRFCSEIRLLAGIKTSLHLCPPAVEVSIISEAQANNLVKNKDMLTDAIMKESSGEILNNKSPMDYNAQTKQLRIDFRNMQLKKIRRTEKKGTESVMDEKFSLLFITRFKINEVTYKAWTLSLPVVAVVHGNQEPHAWATITWDNAFAEPNRLPFVIPDKVAWSKVGEVLSAKFKNKIGKGLSKENLKFLAGKVFRNNNINDYDQVPLSWSLFSKEALIDKTFTFWEWFFAIFKLTKDQLKNLWVDDLITFISKSQAEKLLLDAPPGSFLLRFSDTELGGISISFRENKSRVINVAPFTANDLKIKGMADRVKDLINLTHLYPDRPKDSVFGKYYSPVTDSESNGYVKAELVTVIPRRSHEACQNEKSIIPNYQMHPDYSYHQYHNGLENGTVQNENNFSNLSDYSFNSANAVSTAPMDCPELNNFIPAYHDEELVQFDSSSLN